MAVSKSKATPAPKKAAAKKAVAKKAALAPASKSKASAPAAQSAAKKVVPVKTVRTAQKTSSATPTKAVAAKKAARKAATPVAKSASARKTSLNKPLESVNLQSHSSPAFQETAPQREHVLLQSYEPTVDEGADPGHFPNDEVLDETDQAQHLQLQEQAAINMKARELNKPESHPDFDGKHCVDCDDEIPAARLSLRRVRCVHCQQFLEEESARQRRMLG